MLVANWVTDNTIVCDYECDQFGAVYMQLYIVTKKHFFDICKKVSPCSCCMDYCQNNSPFLKG